MLNDDQTQVIPVHFGRLRRWYYTKWPLKVVCPLTNWHHKWRIDPDGDHIGGDDLICVCGALGFLADDR